MITLKHWSHSSSRSSVTKLQALTVALLCYSQGITIIKPIFNQFKHSFRYCKLLWSLRLENVKIFRKSRVVLRTEWLNCLDQFLNGLIHQTQRCSDSWWAIWTTMYSQTVNDPIKAVFVQISGLHLQPPPQQVYPSAAGEWTLRWLTAQTGFYRVHYFLQWSQRKKSSIRWHALSKQLLQTKASLQH